MHRAFKISSLLLVLHILSVLSQEDEKCDNGPFGLSGVCVPLQNCSVLLNVAQQNPKTPEMLRILAQSQCGFVGTDTKHCCPENVEETVDGPDNAGTNKENDTESSTKSDEDLATRLTFQNRPVLNGQWWLTSPNWIGTTPRPTQRSTNWWETTSRPTQRSTNWWENTPRPTQRSTNWWENTPRPTQKSTNWWENTPRPTQKSTNSWANTPRPTQRSTNWWENTPRPTQSSTNWWENTPRPTQSSTNWWETTARPTQKSTNVWSATTFGTTKNDAPIWGPASEPSASVVDSNKLSLLPLDTCGAALIDRIVNGKKVALGSQPWMARLGYKSRFGKGVVYNCGGSLITKRYVVSAAHCVKTTWQLTTVMLGEHDVDTDIDCEQRAGFDPICSPAPQVFNVLQYISHPEYDAKKYYNDVALILLDKEADLSTSAVQPICLPIGELQHKTYINKKLFVTGWGTTELGISSRVLLGAYVRVSDIPSCHRTYQKQTTITDSQICAGGVQDSCSGDSGGPLSVIDLIEETPRTVLVGVVSFGPKDCGQEDKPGVYARVGYYLPWILKNIN